jgi:curved DNA-binding protein CbpA
MNPRRCPYEILGVTETATDEEIRHAYEILAFNYHPETYRDKNGERDTSKV